MLSFVEMGNQEGPTVVFMAGYPDSETSAWGPLIPQELAESRRLIMCCMPEFSFSDGKTKRKFRPWGYSIEEIVDMLHATLLSLDAISPDNSKKIYLVGHDWGSLISIMFENRYPQSVEKLALFDVGLIRHADLRQTFLIGLYWIWWAVAYILSQTVSESMGQVLFLLYFLPFIQKIVGVSTAREPIAVPRKELKVRKNYPYYQLVKLMIKTGSTDPLQLKMPACPILYMYGLKKRLMFHDSTFLSDLSGSAGSKHVAVNAGHWLQLAEPGVVVDELKGFLA